MFTITLMKNRLIITLFLCSIFAGKVSAQEAGTSESFGRTLNLGLGVGYYGYVGGFMPVIHANYEFQLANNFTLAPFITVYTYRKYHYWGNSNHPYRDYYYRQTVIPVGVKGTYYFDKLLGLNSKWDIYGAGSLGFAIRSTRWESGYNGDVTIARSSSGLYLDAHLGAEYHINSKAGLFLDLSSGLSTFGVAFHM